MKRVKQLREAAVKAAVSLGIDDKTGLNHSGGENGGIPAFLRMTEEERAKARAETPVKPMPLFAQSERPIDPSVLAFIEEQKAKAEANVASAKKTLEKAERAARTPRPSRDGMISVASVAEELGMLPREARAILRAAKIAKPPQGWAFTSGSDLEKQIRAALASPPAKAERAPRGERKTSRKSTPKVPPPAETTWSGSKKDHRKWAADHAKHQSSSSDKPSASSTSKPSSGKQKPQSRTPRSVIIDTVTQLQQLLLREIAVSATASRTRPTTSSAPAKKSSKKSRASAKRR